MLIDYCGLDAPPMDPTHESTQTKRMKKEKKGQVFCCMYWRKLANTGFLPFISVEDQHLLVFQYTCKRKTRNYWSNSNYCRTQVFRSLCQRKASIYQFSNVRICGKPVIIDQRQNCIFHIFLGKPVFTSFLLVHTEVRLAKQSFSLFFLFSFSVYGWGGGSRVRST